MAKPLIRRTLLLLVLCWTVTPHATEETTQQLLLKDGRKLDLRISTQFSTDMQENLLRWIKFLSNTLAQVYGHWPREQLQVTVVPVSAAADDPIPWAQVHRGEPDRIEFFTVTSATQDQLKHAWTGYHEFAHLLIPYRGWGDAWFSEGLASYYQNVLQVRAGILSEQQMWQKLYEGYQRGLADTKFDGQALQSVSDNLRSAGGFMRVYWSGAWYFLAADIRLRLRSNGRHTLDRALRKLNNCCADQSMSVPQMVRKLDELNEETLFGLLYKQAIASSRIPSFEPLFADLGIAVADGRVQLEQYGKGPILRRQIVTADAL